MTTPDPVERLLAVYFAGRSAPSAPSPEELCRNCPELLSELQKRIATSELEEAQLKPIDVAPTAEFPERLGEYVIRRVLGRGGMGVVLLAEDPHLGRPVAIKVMLPRLALDPVAARFVREARAAAAIRNDHVVPIYHVGEQDGTPFLVMPLLEGESLAARLRRGPLPIAEVARVGHEAAAGLAAAHAQGVVHRDVKSANLWLESPVGRVLVLDFGLARSTNRVAGLTFPGAVFGTPAYMAPEQANGQEVDARADLFSLGVVLYEAATGVAPFDGPTLTAILRAVADHHPDPPRKVNPAVTASLSDLIMRLLAKKPVDRPASAAVVSQELAADRPPATAHPISEHRASRRRRWRVPAAALALLVVGVAVWSATRPPATADSNSGAARPPDPKAAPALNPSGSVKYRGSADLYVYRKDDNNSDRLVPLWDPRAMPLRPDDQVKLIAEIDPPAFLYVFWIDEKAETVPAYPWRFGEWGTRPAEEPASRVDAKWPSGEALKIEGARAGTETVLMLALPTKLEAPDAEVQKWFAGLQPVPFQGDKARVWFEDFDVLTTDRDRAPGKAGDLGGARGLQAELRRRIGALATFSRSVSFSRRGAD